MTTNKSLTAKVEDRKKEVETGDVNLPVENKPSEIFANFMKRHESDFKMVIPTHLKPERVIRLAVSACKRNPELMKCELSTVIGGLLEASSLGLEVNSPLQQSFLIPFNNNKTKKKEATLVIGYQGLIDLFYNHDKVLSVFASAVYENDKFDYQYGTDEYLIHVPNDTGEKGKIIGFYAYVKMKDGAYRFIYMSVAEVNKIRDEHSKSYQMSADDSPWTTHYESMGCKTVVRAIQKFIPKASEVQRAVSSDFKVIDPFNSDQYQSVDGE